MAKHTIEELKQWQSLSLNTKLNMSASRIRGWIHEYGEEGVYVSFSGGKDSTVLLDIVRNYCGYKEIPAVFVDTGLEYPEIREFVKTFDNVVWLKPKMNFRQVIEKYGYPFISKDVSGAIEETNQFINKLKKQGIDVPSDVLGFISEQWEKGVDFGYPNKMPVRVLQMIGKVPHKSKGQYTGELSQMYDRSRWGFALNMPYGKLSNKCCQIMKKGPIKEYAHKTHRNPITGQMACESQARQAQWLLKGCNSFDSKNPMSNPLAFWTEQDILQYIKTKNLPICSVYGDVVEDDSDVIDGQMRFDDLTPDLWSDKLEQPKLKTTGCDRTGCMFCGYGCHLERGKGRFERMKETHPKQYEWIMKPWDDGGLNYKNVIDWINQNGNQNIRY